jgi:hypothetical protein
MVDLRVLYFSLRIFKSDLFFRDYPCMAQDNTNKENNNINKYNIVMPETDDRVLCLRVEKPISPEGYSENFAPRIRAMIEKHGGIRLLVYFCAYKGWEAEAALMNMGGLVEFGPKVIKFAMVNPPKKELVRHNVNKPLMAGETRTFEESELAEALAWVRS